MKLKSIAEIEYALARIEEAEQLHYENAQVDVNAPLALIQISERAKANTLRWILGLPPFKRGQKYAEQKRLARKSRCRCGSRC